MCGGAGLGVGVGVGEGVGGSACVHVSALKFASVHLSLRLFRLHPTLRPFALSNVQLGSSRSKQSKQSQRTVPAEQGAGRAIAL